MTDTSSSTALVLIQRISAPREAVFEFLVDPAKLSRWMGDATIDPTPGGVFRLDINDHTALGEYVVVDPPRSVSFTWGWENGAAVPPGSTTVTISLTDDGEGTLVQLRHDGLPLGPEDEHKVGWTMCLDRLPDAVASS